MHARAVTVLEYSPEIYQHDAVLMLYYDNMNNLYLRKYYSETLHLEALGIIQQENGHKTEYQSTRTAVEKRCPVWMRMTIDGRKTFFEWSYDGSLWKRIGKEWDTSFFSMSTASMVSLPGQWSGFLPEIPCCMKNARISIGLI